MSAALPGLAALTAGSVVALLLVGSPGRDAVAAPDTVAPSLSVHQAFRFVVGEQLSDSGPSPRIRVRATWVRSDPSGVCAQRVVVRDLAKASSSATTLRPGRDASFVPLDAVVGHRYRVEVRATDCAGNETTRTRTLSVRLLQESDGPVYLDDADAPWNIERRPQASGGAWAFHQGQVVVFAATRSIALVGATGPGRGAAQVTSVSGTPTWLDLDGEPRARVVVFQERWDELSDAEQPVLELLMEAPVVVDAVLLG